MAATEGTLSCTERVKQSIEAYSSRFAFGTVLLVDIIDQLGSGFLMPVVLPLGKVMGASNVEIAFFGTVRGLCMMISVIWLSMLGDRTSRKIAVMTSLVGSGIAYALQGFSMESAEPIIFFTIACGLSGFFAGSSPVLRASVADLYHSDPSDMKQKLTILQVFRNGFMLILSPIGGSLSRYELTLPFWIAAVASAFALLWSLVVFPTRTSGQTKKLAASDPVEESETEKNPYKDCLVLSMPLAVFFMVSALNGASGYLIPSIFYEVESFGFSTLGSTEERAAAVAQTAGFLMLANGVANFFATMFLYAPLTNRFGDAPVCAVFGLCASGLVALHGMCTQAWQLIALSGCVGFFFAVLPPAIAVTFAKYAECVYPKKKAQVQGIPLIGVGLATAFGQNIFQIASHYSGYWGAWMVAGSMILIGAAVTSVTILRIKRVIKATKQVMTPEQTQTVMRDQCELPETFIQDSQRKLGEYLHQNKDKLWNTPIQLLIEKRMHSLVPTFSWDDNTQGKAYLTELYDALEPHPEIRDRFQQLFSSQILARLESGHAVQSWGCNHRS